MATKSAKEFVGFDHPTVVSWPPHHETITSIHMNLTSHTSWFPGTFLPLIVCVYLFSNYRS